MKLMQPMRDRHRLRQALLEARKSKDPNTQVGAIIVDTNDNFVSAGYNRFPPGVLDTQERWNDRELKLRLVVHAEMAAVLSAGRMGMPIDGFTLYMAATDSSGITWGGCPCTRCTVEMRMAGIGGVVTLPMKTVPSRWREDIDFARGLFDEAGLFLREVRL